MYKKARCTYRAVIFYLQNEHFARAFLCRFCTTTTWKCLISHFMENVNKQRENFISLSELVYGPLIFNFRRVAYSLPSKWEGIILRYRLKERKFFFWATFSSPSRHWIMRSLMLEKVDEWYEDCKEKAYCVIMRYIISNLHLNVLLSHAIIWYLKCHKSCSHILLLLFFYQDNLVSKTGESGGGMYCISILLI